MTWHFNIHAQQINGNVIKNEVGTRADVLAVLGMAKATSGVEELELAA